jgi:hypothetical protein
MIVNNAEDYVFSSAIDFSGRKGLVILQRFNLSVINAL